MLKKPGITLLLLIVTVTLVLYVLGNGVLGKVEHTGRIEGEALLAEVIAQRELRQQPGNAARDKKILFRDFHVQAI